MLSTLRTIKGICTFVKMFSISASSWYLSYGCSESTKFLFRYLQHVFYRQKAFRKLIQIQVFAPLEITIKYTKYLTILLSISNTRCNVYELFFQTWLCRDWSCIWLLEPCLTVLHIWLWVFFVNSFEMVFCTNKNTTVRCDVNTYDAQTLMFYYPIENAFL